MFLKVQNSVFKNWKNVGQKNTKSITNPDKSPDGWANMFYMKKTHLNTLKNVKTCLNNLSREFWGLNMNKMPIPSILYQWNKFGRNILHSIATKDCYHLSNIIWIWCTSVLIFWLFLCRMVLYECCPGYMKLEGKRGCPAGQYSFISPIEIYFLKRFLVWVVIWLLKCSAWYGSSACIFCIFSMQHNFWGVIMSVAHMTKVNMVILIAMHQQLSHVWLQFKVMLRLNVRLFIGYEFSGGEH